jgi:tetratricopeptide (TPR) repeat protein
MAFLARSRGNSQAYISVTKWRARAALAAIALCAYMTSFGLGLAQDSRTIVMSDSRLQAVTADNVGLILTKNYWWPKSGDGLYRPVTTLSYLVNYSVLGNGPNAAGYHVINFLLHVINIWLLYELALLIFGRAGPAFFAAALWAVHPIGTESVTSIVGRADLLAAMSVLGGLLLYIRNRRPWAPVALFAVATLGVFAKENAAVLIGIMLLWDLTFGEKPRWQSYAAVAASLVLLAIVRHQVLGALPVAEPPYVDNPLFRTDFLTARWTALKVVGLDLWLLLVPITLSSDRSQVLISAISDSWVWLSLLVIGALLAVAILRRTKDRVLFWCVGFLAIALLPTSNLIVLIGSAMAERFLYLPSIAFAILVAAMVYRLKNEQHARIVLIAIVALYAVRTLTRNPAWNDNISLATTDIPTSPRSFRLRDMLAKELYDKDTRGNIDRVIQLAEESWQLIAPIPPRQSTSFIPLALGLYYSSKADFVAPVEQRGWYEKSLATLLKAREISRAIDKDYEELQRARGEVISRAANQEMYLTLANVYMHIGDYHEAVEALRYAKGIKPQTTEVYDGLVLAYSTLGDFSMAVTSMEEKALVDNFQPATMGAIRDLYLKIPDGQCAFVQHGSNWEFNMAGCPRVKGDVCNAFAELAQAYRDARSPANAAQVQAAAIQRYGCPVTY